MSILSIKDMNVRFKTPDGEVHAVSNLSYNIHKGETLGIVGESGSGKSQSVFALMGLTADNGIVSGEASFHGENLLSMSKKQLNHIRAEKIGMIFQDPMTSLNPFMKVGKQLAEVLMVHKGMNRSEATREAITMLDAVRIPSAATRMAQYPHEMSGGMRQRVMIAMALLCKPELLIADEPTTALDVTVQAQILSLLRDLQAEFHTAILLITHDMGVVAEVCKYYSGVQALKPLSMQLKAGEVLGLFGHNGAGKSTLMKLILGVLKPSGGSLTVLGHDPRANNDHAYRTQFGYLPENVSFYEHLSGREVLNYLAKLKGHSKADAEHLLDQVNLSAAADRAVKTYSKGMRQRLGLAQAFLGNPKLLILDEPTVGLDPVATGEFYHTVDKLKSGGCAVILCSHVLPGVEQHIDQAMILSKGQKLAFGSIDQLRKEAQLPVEISVSGLNAEQLQQQISSPAMRELPVAQNQLQTASCRFALAAEDKMALVKQLSALPQVSDLQVKLPTLEDLYRFYFADGNEQQAVAGANNG